MHVSLVGRARALDLLLDGIDPARVAGELGVGTRQIYRWAILAGMRFQRGRPGGLISLPLPSDAARSGHGRRLAVSDRAVIQAGVEQGLSLRQIAGMIGFAPSTVSRELSRASLTYRSARQYHAGAAEHRAGTLRLRPKPKLLDRNRLLREAVITGLNSKFSPEQVAGQLSVVFPGREDMRVSHETIYQALYVQGKGALRQELLVTKALRSGRTGRVPQSRLPRKSNRPWLDGARLSDRPAEVEDRAVPGHWEGDLVVGPDVSGIVTLIERTSRFCLIGRLPGTRDSETVIDRMTSMIQTLPAAILKTLTWDQGTEMANHRAFTVSTGCRVFFCDPHSPWQRGSNENLNGLIRDFYPKGTNFNDLTDDEIASMQNLLNIRPRKTLHWATPTEKLNELIRSVALTP